MAQASSPLLPMLCAVIGLAASPPSAASPFSPLPSPFMIEVFTTAEYPIALPPAGQTARIEVWRLDAVDELAAELSRDLPADPQAALEVARGRFAENRPRLAARTGTAIAGLQRAAALGVQRYPAIAFDGRHVVYGVADVAVALELYRTQGRIRP